MRKIIITIILIIILGIFSHAAKVGTLTDVLKPQCIQVSGDRLYIMEEATIFAYSLKDLKLLSRFGKKGEGPGEMKATVQYYNNISVLEDKVFVDSIDKILYFSKDGKFLSEKRKPVGLHQIIPVGKNLVASKLADMVDKVQYSSVYLYDENMKLIKKLYTHRSPTQSGLLSHEMIFDIISVSVSDDKIFIEKSRDGFKIDVFDSEGKLLYAIDKKVPSLKVTKKHRETALTELKADPFIKAIGFERFTQRMKLEYPDTFPPIQDIIVSGQKIYTRTFKQKDNKEEVLILSASGRLQITVRYPPP